MSDYELMHKNSPCGKIAFVFLIDCPYPHKTASFQKADKYELKYVTSGKCRKVHSCLTGEILSIKFLRLHPTGDIVGWGFTLVIIISGSLYF